MKDELIRTARAHAERILLANGGGSRLEGAMSRIRTNF